MAADRENSRNPRSGHPTRSPICENWSGGVMHNALGSHFTKKHMFCPFWPLIKCKIHFFVSTQKTLVTKVVGNRKMHITAKNVVKIQNFAIELAQTKINWEESQVKSSLVPFFVKSFYMKRRYAMFGIFPRYYITYHDSMHWFSIFLIFLISFAPISNISQTRGARRVC
jgi:hypothetical protein